MSSSSKDRAMREARRAYRAEHGHAQDDFKARIDCIVCQVKALVEHAIIARQASGSHDRCLEMIDETGYSDEVKGRAKQAMEATK